MHVRREKNMSEYLSSVKAAEQEVKAARRQLNQAEKNKKNQRMGEQRDLIVALPD